MPASEPFKSTSRNLVSLAEPAFISQAMAALSLGKQTMPSKSSDEFLERFRPIQEPLPNCQSYTRPLFVSS